MAGGALRGRVRMAVGVGRPVRRVVAVPAVLAVPAVRAVPAVPAVPAAAGRVALLTAEPMAVRAVRAAKAAAAASRGAAAVATPAAVRGRAAAALAVAPAAAAVVAVVAVVAVARPPRSYDPDVPGPCRLPVCSARLTYPERPANPMYSTRRTYRTQPEEWRKSLESRNPTYRSPPVDRSRLRRRRYPGWHWIREHRWIRGGCWILGRRTVRGHWGVPASRSPPKNLMHRTRRTIRSFRMVVALGAAAAARPYRDGIHSPPVRAPCRLLRHPRQGALSGQNGAGVGWLGAESRAGNRMCH
jgi:hypothetical protein